jgi:hypothetical protein
MTVRLLCAADTGSFHHVRHIDVLSKAGVEVHLVDHGDYRPGSTAASRHVRWPASGRRVLRRLLGARTADSVADWWEIHALRRIWNRAKADVCHVHWVDGRLTRAADAGLRPLVVTAYGSDMNWTREAWYDPAQLEQVKRGLAQVDLFIADSKDMIEIAEGLVGRKVPSLLLPIGVDTSLFRPAYGEEAEALRNELEIPNGSPLVFSPRLMRVNYRQVEIVQAFAYAVNAHGLDGYLLLKAFLCDPCYVGQVRAAAERCGVARRIRIVDEVPYERLPILYAASDLVVNYPKLDAFPVTFLEASACEKPILTHHLPAYANHGMGEFLNLVEPQDTATMGQMMAALIGDPEAVVKARGSRLHVAARYDEAYFVEALLSAYSSLRPVARC